MLSARLINAEFSFLKTHNKQEWIQQYSLLTIPVFLLKKMGRCFMTFNNVKHSLEMGEVHYA